MRANYIVNWTLGNTFQYNSGAVNATIENVQVALDVYMNTMRIYIYNKEKSAPIYMK